MFGCTAEAFLGLGFSYIIKAFCFCFVSFLSFFRTGVYSCSDASHLILRYPLEPEPPEPRSKDVSITPPPPPPEPPN